MTMVSYASFIQQRNKSFSLAKYFFALVEQVTFEVGDAQILNGSFRLGHFII